MENEISRYNKEKILNKNAYGELDHPESASINLKNVSHYITNLQKENSDFIGKAKIASTPMGKITSNLIDDGANLGVSSRGVGALRENNGLLEVQEGYRLITAADIVSDPSAPSAFVRGILENVDYWYDSSNDSFVQENMDNTKKRLKQMKKHEIEENMVKLFELHLEAVRAGKLTIF